MGGLPSQVKCVVLLVALGLCRASPVPEDDSCYSTASAPYRLYTTHTSYSDVRGHGTDFTMSGCTPKKFYLLSRHGIRYPTSSSYESEKHRLPHIHSLVVASMSKGTLCQSDQDAIRHWQYRFHSHQAGALADNGRIEATELGRRYAQRFPNLVGRPYSRDHYDFVHTHVQRTADTARAIGQGFFNTSNIHMVTGSSHCDPLLLYYTCCQKYRKTVHDIHQVEHTAFRSSHEIQTMMSAVTHRLGLHQNSISFSDVESMYDSCAFEHGVFKNSPWCAAFSSDDLRTLEYYKDLRNYWEYGYGHSITYEQTCDLFKDIMGYLRGSSSVTGMVRVAHDLTLMPMYARLGAFHDSVAPTARNYAQQTNRKFRASDLAPFNGNIAFVEYQCGSVSKVRVFHNEKPLALPMCPEAGCPLSDIVNSYLGKFADACDFQQTCDTHHSCNGHVTHSGSCVPTVIG